MFWAHSLLHLIRPPGVWLIAPMLVVLSAPLREDRGTLRLAAGATLAVAGPTLSRALTEGGTVHAIDTGPALLTALAGLVVALVPRQGHARWWLLVAGEVVAVIGCCACELFVGAPPLAVLASALWGVVSAAAARPVARALTGLSRVLPQRRRPAR